MDLKTAILKSKGQPVELERQLASLIEEGRTFFINLQKEVDARIAQFEKDLEFKTEKSIFQYIRSERVFKGEKGDKGDSITGPQGPEGKPSTVPGPMGPKPISGVDYKIPKDGKDGRDGKDGQSITGPAGRDGKDGSPDQPLEIAAKLNTTTESVDMSVIKGLSKYLTSFTKSFKEKATAKSGGGMGNIVHQSTNVSSATTTVTTAKKIAGSGYALWVYYQGQLIARGVGYTVGADFKTLTLLFTPQDSTAIDIIYIRS